MAALPRLRHRRVSRRLATAAGVIAGSTLIGSSLAGLNGSVLPFHGWPSSHGGGATPTVLLPAPEAPRLRAQAPSATPAGPGIPVTALSGFRAPLRPSLRTAARGGAGRPSRLEVRAQTSPHAEAGASAPVTVVPAPASPPAPAPAPLPSPAPTPAPQQSRPVPDARAPSHGHGHGKDHELASAAPSAPQSDPVAPSSAAVAAVNPPRGRGEHGKGLPPGQAKKAAPAPAAPDAAPAAPAAPATATAPAAAPASPAPEAEPPGHRPGHGRGNG
jgi:hypothetical protein